MRPSIDIFNILNVIVTAFLFTGTSGPPGPNWENKRARGPLPPGTLAAPPALHPSICRLPEAEGIPHLTFRSTGYCKHICSLVMRQWSKGFKAEGGSHPHLSGEPCGQACPLVEKGEAAGLQSLHLQREKVLTTYLCDQHISKHGCNLRGRG